MRIVGDWFLFDDGESRPILRAKLRTNRGTTVTEQFLVDTGQKRIRRPRAACTCSNASSIRGNPGYALKRRTVRQVRQERAHGAYPALGDLAGAAIRTELTPRHRRQLYNYLLLLDLAHGKLVNLRLESVQHEFVNALLRADERRVFEVCTDR